MICDIAIILFMLICFFSGWKKGFVRSVYSLISILICIIVTYFLSNSVSRFLAETEWGLKFGEMLASSYIGFAADECAKSVISIVSVILVYFISKIALKFLLGFLDSLSSLPLISFFNSVLGLVFNGVMGALWIVILVNLMYSLPQTQNAIIESEIVSELELLLFQ